MSFVEIMQIYFRGEKLEALWFILPIGIFLIILGIVTLKAEHGGFAWGVAIPCLIFGIIFMGTGIGVGTRTKGQVAQIEQSYLKNPVEMVQKELPRMKKVNTNFKLTYIILGVLIAAGLCIHYMGGANWGRGLGAALILVSAIGLLVDGFAERRVEPYTAVLEHIAETKPELQDTE
jgi:hypothetical protein